MTWRPAITHVYALLGAVFAVPIAALSFWQSHDLALERAEEWDRQLLSRAHDVADDVRMVLQLRLEEVERMATRARHIESWREPAQLRGIFDDRSGTSGFLRVYLLDPWGTSLVSSPERGPEGEAQAGINYADRPYYRQLLADPRPAVGDAVLGRRTREPTVTLAAPVFHPAGGDPVGGDPVGDPAAPPRVRAFVIGALHIAQLASLIDANARASRTRVVLVDGAGAVLADSSKHLAALAAFGAGPPPRAAEVATVDEPGRDGAARRASVPVAFAGATWRVYVSMPSAQIAARIDEISGDLRLATGGALLFSMGLVYLMALGARGDMRRFKHLQQRIGQGDYVRPGPTARFAPLEAHEMWQGMEVMVDRLDEERTTRLRLIAELQHANEHARSLAAGLRDAHDGFVVLDRERRIVYVNPAWLRMRDLRREQVLGKKSLELDPEQGVSAAHILAIDEALRNNKPWSGTVSFRHRDGSAREADLSISPVFDDHCEVEHYVELVRDVTARREAEAAMQQSERLASLGMLAAGVAHEINNPMTYVLGNLEHLSELAQDGALEVEPAAEVDLALCLADCIHGARRVIQIVSDLRALSQQRQDEKAVASALQTIEICLRMAQSQIRHRAEVVRRFPTEDLWLGINAQRLSQVVLNLLLNGVQAMSASHATTNKLTVAVRRRSDGRGEISVSDTGTGMSLEVAQRIFDPFFTTKGTGVGTGLGLSICHSIVTGAHGEILVESELGKGTCFRIVLPLAQLAEETAATQLASLRGLSVLVVDDEPGVLTAIRRMLATCRTSTASSVKQALEMIEHDHYDLVLSDVMMAEVSGVELVNALRARAPALARRVCLMSGGLIGNDLEQAVKTIGVPLLHKPLTRGELHQALWEVHRAAA
jgi:PAS domain S-box-containing protein